MRLSSLCLAVVLIFSPAAYTQHSAGGGGSSGGSSGGGSHASSSGGSSGGGSHSSYAGGSSSSASSHGSGGSVSRGGTVSHGSSVRASTSGKSSFNSSTREPRSNAMRSIREPNAGVGAKSEASGKQRFFSFLRHPFRKSSPKPEPKAEPVAERHRICFKGPCHFCPTGQVSARGGCLAIPLRNNGYSSCSQSEIWNGNACLLQARFLDDCSGLRLAMERQAQRMQAAEAAQQSACVSGPGQQCSDLSSTAQSEAGLYRSRQDRYNRCRLTAYPFSGLGIWNHSSGLLFDPFEAEFDYP